MLEKKLSDYENIVNRCIGCNFCIENSWVGPYHGCPVYDITEFESYGSRGRNLIMSLLIKGDPNLKLDKRLADRLLSCADCGYCDEFCMTGLPLEELRLVLNNYIIEHVEDLPSSFKVARNKLLKTGNIFGQDDSKKFSWINDSSVIDVKNAEIVYFAGCSTQYSQTQIGKAVINILKKTHADFTVLSGEKCCGYPFYAAGDLENGVKFTEANIELFKKIKPKIVLFNCPGCMKTFTKTYSLVTGKAFPFKAMHIVEYLNKYAHDNKLTFKLDKPIVATYHDPCHLGRGLGIYDAPRELLSLIDNLKLVEMPRSRERSYCCGGALTTTNPKMKYDVSHRRYNEAVETKASVFLQACPTCTLNLKKASAKDGKMKVIDIVELFSEIFDTMYPKE
ncbi:MAG: (Fe-S)-binding protein [Candidatus Asgardarchaeia archaeon]